MTIIDKPSPNQSSRPAGVSPDLIVIHATAGKSDAGDLSWLCNAASRVSYHYMVGRDGTVYRLVRPERRAWHAGVSTWEGRTNCNDFSLGISFSNDGKEAYRPAQYDAGAKLAAILMRRFKIPVERVVGHADVSPGRKTDPYAHFDWEHFRSLLAAA